MRTEDDLRGAIDALAESAPADAVARLQLPAAQSSARPPKRRLALAVGAIAVAILAVGLGVVLRPQQGAPADRRVPGNWQMISRVETPPPGWRVVGRGIDGASEYTELTSGQGQGRSCSLVVYGRGQLAADQSTGQPVRIHDQPATYTPATALEPATLTWAYDVDAYARMVCLVDRPAAELIEVASAARFDRSVDIPVPFRIEDLPAGYHPQSVHSRTEDGLNSVGVLVQSNGSPTIAVANATSTFDPPGPGLPGVEDLEINGQATTVREDQRALSMSAADGYLQVSSYASEPQSWQPGEKSC